jgi:lipopolysaccharide export system protein LptA
MVVMTFYPGRVGLVLMLASALTMGVGGQRFPTATPVAQAQARDTITLRSDVQEANTNTGVITARGNVQIDYPAENIRATSAQADYYTNERRIVLSGNVLIDQEGSTLRAEVVTYLIDEGRFIAMPVPSQQVEAIYLLPPAEPSTAQSPAPELGRPAARPPLILDVPPLEQAPPSVPLEQAPR